MKGVADVFLNARRGLTLATVPSELREKGAMQTPTLERG
jgi:hypothetical protein